jgi:hypothetical protein
MDTDERGWVGVTRLCSCAIVTVALFLACTSVGGGQEVQGKQKDVGAKPVRILLMASGPSREYRFVRDLLLREVEDKRVQLSIHLQSEAAGENCQQGIPAGRMLKQFPSTLHAADGTGLNQFDLVVALDADWLEVPTASLRRLQEWAGNHGGGLILVAGGVSSHCLAQPGGVDLTPLLTMLPVRLRDTRLSMTLDQSQPHALRIVDPLPEILKLDDADKSAKATWDTYFWDGKPPGDLKQARPVRGFFTCNPAESIAPGARHLASLALGEDRTEPFLVTMPYGAGRVVYVGSAELWRLRQLRTAYHDRLWLNLIRYAAANARTDAPGTSLFQAAGQVTEGRVVIVEARLLDSGGKPLDRSSRPVLRITAPGSKEPANTVMLLPQGLRITGSPKYRRHVGFLQENQGPGRRRSVFWRCSTSPGGPAVAIRSSGEATPGFRQRFVCSRDCDLLES